jgi:hypothetical protein
MSKSNAAAYYEAGFVVALVLRRTTVPAYASTVPEDDWHERYFDQMSTIPAKVGFAVGFYAGYAAVLEYGGNEELANSLASKDVGRAHRMAPHDQKAAIVKMREWVRENRRDVERIAQELDDLDVLRQDEIDFIMRDIRDGYGTDEGLAKLRADKADELKAFRKEKKALAGGLPAE